MPGQISVTNIVILGSVIFFYLWRVRTSLHRPQLPNSRLEKLNRPFSEFKNG